DSASQFRELNIREDLLILTGCNLLPVRDPSPQSLSIVFVRIPHDEILASSLPAICNLSP
ncbi:hypothetical protein M405DRAFT_826867, partial [Rhizopogon salebrosus TDB-379]